MNRRFGAPEAGRLALELFYFRHTTVILHRLLGDSRAALIALVVAAVMFAAPAPAQNYTESVIYNFSGGNDGQAPANAPLIQASDGNLYGTTLFGGSGNCSGGCGTVFKISNLSTIPTASVIYAFGGLSDGARPNGVIQASDGNLYGATTLGGSGCGGSGCGTVFEISNLTTTPTESVVYAFGFGGSGDGADPQAPLFQASDGNLYGTTQFGGSNICDRGCGTVFKISNLNATPDESVIISFQTEEGVFPDAPLIQASDGNLYGTTFQAGVGTSAGTVFKITNLATSPSETVIHSFGGGSDGEFPEASLIQASDGNLYGTTVAGGQGPCTIIYTDSRGCGTVFRIVDVATTPSESVIYSFNESSDGAYPLASLIEGTDGSLYGTTSVAGSLGYGAGAVFKISNVGTSPIESVIHTFGLMGDGANPSAALILASDGNLYGTTGAGGSDASGCGGYGCGTVFKIALAAPLGPCVASDTTLCIDDQLGDSRYQIQVGFSSIQGGGVLGNGHAIPLAPLGVARAGAFSFFSVDNPELLVKVLDGCATDGDKWVFESADTNVGYSITVTDTKTGEAKTYSNPDLTSALPVQDTSAFLCDSRSASARATSASGQSSSRIEPAKGQPFGMTEGADAPSPCVPGDTTLCIDSQPGDKRFKVEVAYQTSEGGGLSGNGHAISLAPVGITHGGIFWFFSADNPEMLVKVLDGCAVDGSQWFFASAGTNVGLTVTVTDTTTGAQKIYTNPDGNPALPIQDTSAFPTCP